jgi:TRAP-type C4-dicarboxylate transport system permease small subunit
MFKFEKFIKALAEKFNWIAAGAVVFMMALTCLDVFLRMFRKSIPGTFEFIGLFGSVVISFSLAYTTMAKGHIAVEFLVQKLSQKKQYLIGFFTDFFSMILFALVSWRSFIYAVELMKAGEVSLTVNFPTYPFIFGIALGCGLQTLLLFTDTVKSLKGAMK